MARHLHISMQNLTSLPQPYTFFLIVLASIFSVFSVVIFLCGAHKAALKALKGKDESKTMRLGGNKSSNPMMKKMQSSLSSKALLMAKMISWRKVVDGGGETEVYEYMEEDGDQDGVIWKKTIIRGGKCQPLDFSGKILYDADGNLLPETSSK